MRTRGAPLARGTIATWARTLRDPRCSTRTTTAGRAGATTVRGASAKRVATGRAGRRTGRSGGTVAPYSTPPDSDGAGAPVAPCGAPAATGASTASSVTIPVAEPAKVRVPHRMARRSGARTGMRALPRRCTTSGPANLQRTCSELQHPCHHLGGAALRQRLVEVAALGRLHARRAARLARALADEAVGVADERVEVAKALQRDPDAPRVPVVDEDRRAPGLRVEVGRQAADVPAVAHGQQREHGDLGVLGGVQRAEQDLVRELFEEVLAQLVPQRLRGERVRRQVDAVEVDDLVVGQALALVGMDLLGDRHPAEAQR